MSVFPAVKHNGCLFCCSHSACFGALLRFNDWMHHRSTTLLCLVVFVVFRQFVDKYFRKSNPVQSSLATATPPHYIFLYLKSNTKSGASAVPAGHHRVEGHPQLLDGLQDAARHCGLQQQGHAGRQHLHVRDEVLRRQQRQVLQDLHQLGSAGRQIQEGWQEENRTRLSSITTGGCKANRCSEARVNVRRCWWREAVGGAWK